MALPPSIPTSFVPLSASAAARRFRVDFTGIFGFFAYIVLGCVIALALGLFFYGRILANQQSAKDAELASVVEKSKDLIIEVEGFVRLRNRLTSSVTLLDKHIAFSSFFSVLEGLMPSTIRFNSLHFSLADTGEVKLSGSGVAKNFNALAAASLAFAEDGRIKNAIFSNIAIGKNNSVSFVLSTTLDPKLVVFLPSAAARVATSTIPSP